MGIAAVITLLIIVAPPLAADDAADFLKAIAARDLPTVQAMLARDSTLANAHRPNGTGAVTVALFAIGKGEQAFHDPAKNDVLQAILAHTPQLDLFETAALGTAPQLEAMLTDAAALTRRTSFGWTLLHMAAFGGNTATTELLIGKGSRIDARADSKFRNTPLQAALLMYKQLRATRGDASITVLRSDGRHERFDCFCPVHCVMGRASWEKGSENAIGRRLNRTQEVIGSIPISSTKVIITLRDDANVVRGTKCLIGSNRHMAASRFFDDLQCV